MSEKYQIPAFPSNSLVNGDTGEVLAPASQGMGLRDWLAGMAMQGLVSITDNRLCPKDRHDDAYQWRLEQYQLDAEFCYLMADSMLAQREKGRP